MKKGNLLDKKLQLAQFLVSADQGRNKMLVSLAASSCPTGREMLRIVTLLSEGNRIREQFLGTLAASLE